MKKLNKQILIVEDEAPIRNALVDKFTREGLRVLEAKNGEEGLEIAIKEKPDLILLDIKMPEMNGMSMLKELREDPWGAGAEVILLTNLSDGMKVSEAMGDRVYDYLVKSDWKIEDVVKKVKEKLEID